MARACGRWPGWATAFWASRLAALVGPSRLGEAGRKEERGRPGGGASWARLGCCAAAVAARVGQKQGEPSWAGSVGWADPANMAFTFLSYFPLLFSISFIA